MLIPKEHKYLLPKNQRKRSVPLIRIADLADLADIELTGTYIDFTTNSQSSKETIPYIISFPNFTYFAKIYCRLCKKSILFYPLGHTLRVGRASP